MTNRTSNNTRNIDQINLDLLPDELGVRPIPFDLWTDTPNNQRVYGPGVRFQDSKRKDY